MPLLLAKPIVIVRRPENLVNPDSIDLYQSPVKKVGPMEQNKKLLDQVRDVIRLKHYSIRTEESYVDWIRRYILFHKKRHPKDMGRAEVEAFLTHLAVEGNVAASTQNQASPGAPPPLCGG